MTVLKCINVSGLVVVGIPRRPWSCSLFELTPNASSISRVYFVLRLCFEAEHIGPDVFDMSPATRFLGFYAVRFQKMEKELNLKNCIYVFCFERNRKKLKHQ